MYNVKENKNGCAEQCMQSTDCRDDDSKKRDVSAERKKSIGETRLQKTCVESLWLEATTEP